MSGGAWDQLILEHSRRKLVGEGCPVAIEEKI
jgi:hypothetical protein